MYSGIFYLGLLAYIAGGISESQHMIFCKKRDGRKGGCKAKEASLEEMIEEEKKRGRMPSDEDKKWAKWFMKKLPRFYAKLRIAEAFLTGIPLVS